MTDRDPNMEAALVRATPRPQREGDWEDVLQRAGTRRRPRWVGRFATAAAMLGGVGLLGVLFIQSSGAPDGRTLSVSVLDRPGLSQADARRLPTDWLANAGIVPATVRLAMQREGAPDFPAGSTYYVARREDDAVCIIEIGPGRLIACGTTTQLKNGGAILLTSQHSVSTWITAGLVADDVTAVRMFGEQTQAAVQNNIFVISGGSQRISVEIVRPSGSRSATGFRPGNLSVFARSATPADSVPEATLKTVEAVAPEITESRLVRSSGRRVWLASAGDDDLFCVLGERLASRCFFWSAAADQGFVFFHLGQPDQAGEATGVALDGYSTATIGDSEVPIVDNTFLFDRPIPPQGVLTLSGPFGSRQIKYDQGGHGGVTRRLRSGRAGGWLGWSSGTDKVLLRIQAAAQDVASVEVRFTDGSVQRVTIDSSGLGDTLLSARYGLPSVQPTELITFDRRGRELWRFDQRFATPAPMQVLAFLGEFNAGVLEELRQTDPRPSP